MTEYLDRYLKECENIGLEIKKDVSMSEHTTFKIGGPADLAVFPNTPEQLVFALELATKLDIPYYVVGRGSNLLVSDNGFRGVIVFTTAMDRIIFDGNTLWADAGVNLTSLSRLAGERGLSGLEFACGIPGTVGGAVYMNAGAYGSEMKNVTQYSEFWSPSEGRGRLVGEEQRFDYRESAYMNSDRIVLGCSITLTLGDKNEIMAACRDLLQKRRDKQPLEYPSAGSAFKRYPGRFTAQMIDEAGLKGFSVGAAEVSTKHAGFIVNKGGATASDVIELVKKVKTVIYQREDIFIESEIRYLSEEGEMVL